MLLWLPASARGGRISFIDALFTSTSAVCVTGLVVVDTATAFSGFGQSVILALIQLGGLGIMTFSSLILLVAGGRVSLQDRLTVQTTFRPSRANDFRSLMTSIFVFTGCLEAAGTLSLFLRFRRDFPAPRALALAVFHGVSAFCNAGFSLFSGNLTGYRGDWTVNVTIMLLIVSGGLGFFVLREIARGTAAAVRRRSFRFSLHSKIVFSHDRGPHPAFRRPPALARARRLDERLFRRGEGLERDLPGRDGEDGRIQHGGPHGVHLGLRLPAHPPDVRRRLSRLDGRRRQDQHRRRHPRLSPVQDAGPGIDLLFRRTIPADDVTKAYTVVSLAMSLIFAMTFTLLLDQPGLGLKEVLFEVCSAFGTVGLSLGITPELTSVNKAALILTMYVGRVGPVTLLYALSRYKAVGRFEYAEESVMIG